MSVRARGFQYVEILVALGILITLAGVVIPIVSVQKMDQHTPTVEEDLQAVAHALNRYARDTRTFPTGPGGAATYHYLFSDGIQPDPNPFASGPGAPLDRFLSRPIDVKGWSGPYLEAAIGPDPYGNAYVVNVNGYFSSSERVIVLCAGPDGRVETHPSATQATGDDVIIVLE